MALQGLPRREDPLPERALPVGVAGRGFDLIDDDVDHAVQELFLVGNVLVERHRYDAQFLREVAHAQRLDPGRVGERDGGPQHAIPVESDPPHLPPGLTGVRRTPYRESRRCTSYTYADHQK